MKTSVHQFANDAVHFLNGARALEARQAATRLRDLMVEVAIANVDSKAAVSALDAYRKLVSKLEAKGAAGDDDWQQAIETMTALAGERAIGVLVWLRDPAQLGTQQAQSVFPERPQ